MAYPESNHTNSLGTNVSYNLSGKNSDSQSYKVTLADDGFKILGDAPTESALYLVTIAAATPMAVLVAWEIDTDDDVCKPFLLVDPLAGSTLFDVEVAFDAIADVADGDWSLALGNASDATYAGKIVLANRLGASADFVVRKL